MLPSLAPVLADATNGAMAKGGADAAAAADEVSSGVLQLLRAGAAAEIKSADAWAVVLSLASSPPLVALPSASARAFDALTEVSRDVCALNFHSLIDALEAHAKAVAAPAGRAELAIDLLFELHAKLEPIVAELRDNRRRAEVVSEEAAWLQLWLPVLRAVFVQCFDKRAVVRDHAVAVLQRALLDGGRRPMPAAVWGRTFEQVVFPLLAELLQRTMDGRLKDERLMQRATTLLSKAFLHHLHHLLALPSFPQLWLRALELLEQYYKSPNNELLLDLVPETLKNMLLVMGASGAFDSKANLPGGDKTLAQVTQVVIAGFCPDLIPDGGDISHLWSAPPPAAAPAPPTTPAKPAEIDAPPSPKTPAAGPAAARLSPKAEEAERKIAAAEDERIAALRAKESAKAADAEQSPEAPATGESAVATPAAKPKPPPEEPASGGMVRWLFG